MKILVWIRAIRVLLDGLPRAASFTPENLSDPESACFDCSSTQEAEFCTLYLSMRFKIEFRPRALRDIKRLSPPVSRRIEQKIELLAEDLTGDVKRLVKYIPGYRLRVGDWRVLFQPEGSRIVIHRIVHRSEAYD